MKQYRTKSLAGKKEEKSVHNIVCHLAIMLLTGAAVYWFYTKE